jgi:hypothetical protein
MALSILKAEEKPVVPRSFPLAGKIVGGVFVVGALVLLVGTMLRWWPWM